MDCPPGMKDLGKDNCILHKCIYSPVQASKQYNKKLLKFKKKALLEAMLTHAFT